ncbi:MAG: ATP-dependent Clp protease proteolytic subunit [Planctomycetes bacterium]|nr:ATP-dependent Clp protease proteolytic subunit [Planctomycetota bacterium]
MHRIFWTLVLCTAVCGCMANFSPHYDDMAKQMYNYNIGRADFDANDPMLGRRIIFISSGFNSAMARMICTQLVYLDAQSKTEPITMCINSGGGDGTAFLAIRNMMQSISAPVDTVNVGMCGSIAVDLFLSATGKRYCVKDSAFIIHEPRGTPADLVKNYTMLQEDLFRSKCEFPKNWLPVKSRQFTITDEDAKKYKMCDEIIQKIKL